VHDHAGGLVDDHEVAVFVEDVERDVLGRDRRRELLGQVVLDNVARRDAVGGAARPAIEQDCRLPGEPRGGGAAEARSVLGQEAVQPRRRRGGCQAVGLRMK
jgi:hypothetical protein